MERKKVTLQCDRIQNAMGKVWFACVQRNVGFPFFLGFQLPGNFSELDYVTIFSEF